MLIGMRLQQAGLAFMEAKAVHGADGTRIQEIVCETREDADRVDAWAKQNGHSLFRARVASPEEVAEWRKWQETGP